MIVWLASFYATVTGVLLLMLGFGARKWRRCRWMSWRDAISLGSTAVADR